MHVLQAPQHLYWLGSLLKEVGLITRLLINIKHKFVFLLYSCMLKSFYWYSLITAFLKY